MTVADFETHELEVLESVLKNKAFEKMIKSRLADIKAFEWNQPVINTEGMIRLAKAKGMHSAWWSMLKMAEDIEDELELREREEEKELASKTKR